MPDGSRSSSDGRLSSRPPDSLLVDGDAKAKLSAAAEAIGCSVSQLVDLAHDASPSVPIEDGITDSMSLEDLGRRLWTLSTAQPKSERAKWFKGLAETQKTALLTVLRQRGYATAVIAHEFDVDPIKVVEAYNRFADNLGARVTNVRMNTIAGQMQLSMEKAMQISSEKGDAATFWRIQKEAIMLMQSMGIVDRAAQKVEVENTVSIGHGEKEEEIRRVLELARRGEQRKLEIEKSESEDVETEKLEEEVPGEDQSE